MATVNSRLKALEELYAAGDDYLKRTGLTPEQAEAKILRKVKGY